MVEYFKARFGLLNGEEETEGQGLVEYALILVLISVVAIGIMGFVGSSVTNVFTSINTALGG
ncbi:MAG TPA: Flp family type IVb pilin [Thermomicrobiales bacterium]|jgi:pilus assembly protein Flp/PilA